MNNGAYRMGSWIKPDSNPDGISAIDWSNLYVCVRDNARKYFSRNSRFKISPHLLQMITRQISPTKANMDSLKNKSILVTSSTAEEPLIFLDKFRPFFDVTIIKRRGSQEKGVDTLIVTKVLNLMHTDPSLESTKVFTLVSSDADFKPLIDNMLERGKRVVVWAFSKSLSRDYELYLKNTKGISLALFDDVFMHIGCSSEMIRSNTYRFSIQNVPSDLSHHDVVQWLVENGITQDQFRIKWDSENNLYIMSSHEETHKTLLEIIDKNSICW